MSGCVRIPNLEIRWKHQVTWLEQTADGVALTVSAIGADWFEVSLIPTTLARTTLGTRQPGAAVNLEVDVIAKYVEKLMAARS